MDRIQAAIGDRYTLGEEIGRGGMATVYLARDIRHERQVAIKVLHAKLASSLGPARFQREIRVAAQLHHPHILPVYDSGAGDELLWFAMPYVEGSTLRQRLKRDGRLPVEEVVSILSDISRALAYAHRRGVIHRDVKPENIMVGDSGVFLADFGVAKPLKPSENPGLTLEGLAVGTPTYMSPEQAVGDPAMDHRADIYSLGVLGYELLTGEPPFADHPMGPLFAAFTNRDPDPVQHRRPEVPPHLAGAISRCLRKEPTERWGSADELCHALAASGGLETVNSAIPEAHTDPFETLERGRAAFARAAWRDAYESFTLAGAKLELEAEDWERLGSAAWWVANGPAALRARERAYRGYLQRGELASAARVALTLAEDYVHRLARSVGQAWLRRAQRHLEGLPDAPEVGWLTRVQMQIALAEGRPEEALDLADRTIEIARRVGDTDLETLALQDRGRALVTLGQVTEGMELIDDAVTAAAAGGLGPLTTGRTFCNMLSTCERLGDLGRAVEWHEVVEAWGEPHAGSAFPGICRVHRAGILRLRGDLPAAAVEATRAAEELESFLFDVAGEAFYELGEIHLRQGDLRAAEAMFREAHVRGRDPQPGLALLQLAQGKVDPAWSMIERALAESRGGALDRAKLLPAMIEISLASGRHASAVEAVAELETTSRTYTSPALRAAVALGQGRLHLATGRAGEAVEELRQAQRMWAEIELPYELAHTRVLLARAYSLRGEAAVAEMEEQAAMTTLRKIGATAGA